jgi:hypothetical protein
MTYIEKMTGYKATDANMQCRGYQFEIGKWFECAEGEIIKCGSNGFHFCPQPSGPWAYYSEPGTRLWKVEAEQVLETPDEPGADSKKVCRRIRFIEEIIPNGDRNTGDGNTGYGNTGYRNTGYRNTGNGNTGNGNTGDGNTGNRNTGDGNTGDRNTGDGNTGDRNTGDGNTGDGNTGDGNTGNRNTGNRNTGDGNTTDYSSGFFCQEEPNVVCFDVDTGMKRGDFLRAFPKYWDLSDALLCDDAINFVSFSDLPGITPEKLASLHAKHIAGRKARQ